MIAEYAVFDIDIEDLAKIGIYACANVLDGRHGKKPDLLYKLTRVGACKMRPEIAKMRVSRIRVRVVIAGREYYDVLRAYGPVGKDKLTLGHYEKIIVVTPRRIIGGQREIRRYTARAIEN